MKTNKCLNKARHLKNDEFFTPFDFSYKLIEKLKLVLDKYKYVLMPFTNKDHLIYKAFKEFVKKEKLSIKIICNENNNYNCYKQKYNNDVIIIDNPPFSKLRDIIENFIKNNNNFFIFSYFLATSYKWFVKNYSNKIFWTKAFFIKYNIPNSLNTKTIPTIFLTNNELIHNIFLNDELINNKEYINEKTYKEIESKGFINNIPITRLNSSKISDQIYYKKLNYESYKIPNTFMKCKIWKNEK